MRHPRQRPAVHRFAGALVALVSLALLALAAAAAIQPRVDNPHGKFKENCQLCHSPQAWKVVKVSTKFDHAKFGFPLSGAHATTNCTGCHTSLDFAQSKKQCVSCHQDQHRGEMGTDCARCHGARSFQDRGPMVRAHQLSRFPLTGSHATLECEGCHKPAAQGRMQFKGTSAECYSCHKAQYDTAPNHKSDGRSMQCQTCHTPVSWSGVTNFDHASAGFPLTGSHSTSVRRCDDCHHGSYTKMSKDCYSCHATTYAGATPTHNPGGFPTATANCINCHQQANANHITWAGAIIDHAAAGFPLTGNHSTSVRQCDDCHKGNYTTTSKDCAACHTNSTPGYANTGPGNPVHNATYFPATQCATCHASAAATHTTWQGGVYTHSTMQLANAHAGRACDDCHKSNYTSVAYNCIGCHQNSTPGYANAVNPTHTPINFPTSNASCLGCHNTTAFAPSLWPRNHSTTAFGAYFTGAHPAQPCTACHNAGTWNVPATGNNCYGCHQNSTPGYATAVPPHDPTNYPIAGCVCHTTSTWQGATAFDHNSVGFALTGSHSLAARQCADCHGVIGYTAKATDKDCITCHASDYNNNTVVKHTSPNFPSTTANCIACHAAANTSHVTWQGGAFANHAGVTTNFALTGNHAGFVCSDCHTSAAADLKQYTCAVSCHTSSSGFNGHGNKSCAGTTFNVAKATGTIKACYSCHPRGTTASAC